MPTYSTDRRPSLVDMPDTDVPQFTTSRSSKNKSNMVSSSILSQTPGQTSIVHRFITNNSSHGKNNPVIPAGHRRPLEDDEMSEVTCDTILHDSSRSGAARIPSLSHPQPRQPQNKNYNATTATTANSQIQPTQSEQQQQHQIQPQQQQRRKSVSSRVSASTAEKDDWGEQMALLKLELATIKAECDRTQWQFGQLLERKQLADKKIAALEKENRDLKLTLRALEKKCLVLSMSNTNTNNSSAHSTSLSNLLQTQHSGDHDVNASSTSGQANPYRTIHEDDEEDDPDEDGLSVGWHHKYKRNNSEDNDDLNSGDENYSVSGSVLSSSNHQFSRRRPSSHSMPSSPISTSASDSHSHMNHQRLDHHRRGNDFSDLHSTGPELIIMDGFQDITIEASSQECTKTQYTASTTQLYPEDDPFSTFNPVDEQDNQGSSWWPWGGKTKP